MKSLISALLVILSISSIGQEIDIPVVGTDSTLEIMTWNIEWFPTNDDITVEYVSDILNMIDVDIIALQEIDDSLAFHQLTMNIEYWSGHHINSQYSRLAYLYNEDVINDVNIYEIFTDEWREFPRAPLVLECTYNDQDLVIVNNHWKCCGDGIIDFTDEWDEETRRYDAAIMLKSYITSNWTNKKVIVTGDFNDILNDTISSNVFSPFILDDNFTVGDSIQAYDTTLFSYPSWPSHIDHIFYSNNIYDSYTTEINTLLLDTYFADNEYENNISDHRPVVIKLDPISTLQVDKIGLNGLISIYPNIIAQGGLIQFKQAFLGELKVFSIDGRLIMQESIESFNYELNTSQLLPQIYLGIIESNEGLVQFKFVVK